MSLLFAIFWPAFAASLGLGGLVGAWSGLPERRYLVAAVIPVGLAVTLTALAVGGPVAGRPGFWIEIAAICLDGYLVGCLIGASLRRLSDRSA
ncbi:MAG: hypothetical protein K2Y56_03965 [Methylobacterium sp.]|uniref:hypothetical protein n=1 Tax=Methylobacterium sp. TaxID=409 RepID=UPI0025CEE772|nr:hypothetical protein [Methylobacterium sp.]MBX9930681.1 hypothetical protein [Methylobacterium sp.]